MALSPELQEFKEKLARQMVALGQVPNEQRVATLIEENLAPVYAELKALRAYRAPVNGERTQRDVALEGTRYARFTDPNTGRRWTADDVEFMHDLLEAAQQQQRGSGPSEKLRNLHAEINTRAMDTAESGYGSELVGVQYVSELWNAARVSSMIFSRLATFELTGPSAYMPVAAAPPEMLYVSESISPDQANYPTSKTGSNRVLVTAKKFLIHQVWSGEMEEDAIIPYIPFLREQAAFSVGYYSDSAVLNGDTVSTATGNINSDDGAPTETKHYLAFNGVRKVGLVDNTDNAINMAGVPTYDKLTDMRTLMLDRTYYIDWGHPMDPDDLLYVAGPETADAIAKIDEVITVDKYGPQAVVLMGEVARIGRNPLLRSIAMPLTEDDGKVSVTAASNTKGQLVTFNRRGVVVGWRRRLKVEVERVARTDQSVIVYSLRMGMGRYSPTGAVAGQEFAAVMRNITVQS